MAGTDGLSILRPSLRLTRPARYPAVSANPFPLRSGPGGAPAFRAACAGLAFPADHCFSICRKFELLSRDGARVPVDASLRTARTGI